MDPQEKPKQSIEELLTEAESGSDVTKKINTLLVLFLLLLGSGLLAWAVSTSWQDISLFRALTAQTAGLLVVGLVILLLALSLRRRN